MNCARGEIYDHAIEQKWSKAFFYHLDYKRHCIKVC